MNSLLQKSSSRFSGSRQSTDKNTEGWYIMLRDATKLISTWISSSLCDTSAECFQCFRAWSPSLPTHLVHQDIYKSKFYLVNLIWKAKNLPQQLSNSYQGIQLYIYPCIKAGILSLPLNSTHRLFFLELCSLRSQLFYFCCFTAFIFQHFDLFHQWLRIRYSFFFKFY